MTAIPNHDACNALEELIKGFCFVGLFILKLSTQVNINRIAYESEKTKRYLNARLCALESESYS